MGRPLTPLLFPPAPLVPTTTAGRPIFMLIFIPIPIPMLLLWSTLREVRVSGELCPSPMPLTPIVLIIGMGTVVGVVVSAFRFTPFFCR